MSNAWLTVASRARCAAPSAQRQPFLHLFRGFQRYHSSHNLTRAQKPAPTVQRSRSVFDHTLAYQHARYSSKASKRKKKSQADDDSKLQPATTVGSHTEGVVENVVGENEGITWRDYDPEGGMPLPNGELPQAEINAIFGGEGVDVDTGNYILSVMQWRRVSGALIDVGLDFPKARQIPRWQALQGLEYLRSLDSSFDEQVAGERWAAEETERLREELRERAVSLKLYKPDPTEEEEESDQGTDYGRQRSGESTLQMMQRHNEAKWEKEQAEKEARERQEQNAEINSARGPLELSGGVQPSVALTKYESLGDVEITGAQTKGWLKPVERKEWVKYYEDQATLIKDNAVPQLSLLQRLGPATLFAVIGLAALLVLSDQYTPPPKSARIFPETAPAVTTIGAITGVILTTFIMSRLPIFWRLSSKYFCIVPAYPFAVSLVGAAWRHDTVSHLAANLTALWLFGLSLHEDVGRGTFLAIFLGGSIFGGWVSLTHSVLLQRWMTYSFGSSGGVLGVAAASCALRPNGSVTIWGVDVPYVTWMLVGLYSLGELYGTVRFHKKTNVDHAGHVGGLLIGVLAAYRLKAQQPAESDIAMKHTPAVESLQS